MIAFKQDTANQNTPILDKYVLSKATDMQLCYTETFKADLWNVCKLFWLIVLSKPDYFQLLLVCD